MMIKPALRFGEFVALMAMMMALASLSTDMMLPALPDIGEDLAVQSANSTQLIISFLFLGTAVGQVAYGPVSDSIGRKPAIYIGYALFICGCLLSIFAPSFPVLLMGRLLQGVGTAGSSSVTLALIRDQYEGRAMARVMSFVMAVFILGPVIAPSIGQAILIAANWRAIFSLLLLIALSTAIWFAVRQPETLPLNRRVPFSLKHILKTVREILSHQTSISYIVSAGLIFGAFLGYINSAQQIFQEQYGLGTQFPLYYSIIALALGGASILNGRLVMRYGMRSLSSWSVLTLVILSIAFSLYSFVVGGHPPLLVLMTFLMTSFLCFGILFGNLNPLAMEPLGHIAGVGSAVVGSLSTFISVSLGIFIGQSYDGTILPLVYGFVILSTLSMVVMSWAEKRIPTPSFSSCKINSIDL